MAGVFFKEPYFDLLLLLLVSSRVLNVLTADEQRSSPPDWRQKALLDFTKEFNLTFMIILTTNDTESSVPSTVGYLNTIGISTIVLDLDFENSSVLLKTALIQNGFAYAAVLSSSLVSSPVWKKVFSQTCNRMSWIFFMANRESLPNFHKFQNLEDCRTKELFLLVPHEIKNYEIYKPVYEGSAPLRFQPQTRFRRCQKCENFAPLDGITIKVVPAMLPAYSVEEGNGTEQWNKFGRDSLWQLHAIQRKYNFKIQMLNFTSNTHQTLADAHNGNWDMLIGPIVVNPTRFGLADFSVLFNVDTTLLMTKKPGLLPKMYVVVWPFTLEVWLLIIFCSVFGMIFAYAIGRKTYVMEKKRSEENSNIKYPAFRRVSWIIFCSLINGGCEIKSFKGKAVLLFLAVWFYCTFIFRTCYSGPLTAFMSFPGYEKAILNLEDLAEAMEKRKDLICTSYKNSAGFFYLEHLENGSLNIIAGRTKTPGMIYSPIEALPEIAKGTYTFLIHSIYAKYYIDSEGYTDSVIIGDPLLLMPAGNAFRPGFPYQEKFNMLMRRFIDMGITHRWLEHMKNMGLIFKPKNFQPQVSEDTSHKPLKVEDLKGAFMFLIFGLSFSIALFIIELLCKKLSRRED